MKHAKKVAGYIQKLIIVLIGTPIVILGVILIPLPGPGVVVTLLGLSIFSLAFEWPKPYVKKMRNVLMAIYSKFLEEKNKIDQKYK